MLDKNFVLELSDQEDGAGRVRTVVRDLSRGDSYVLPETLPVIELDSDGPDIIEIGVKRNRKRRKLVHEPESSSARLANKLALETESEDRPDETSLRVVIWMKVRPAEVPGGPN